MIIKKVNFVAIAFHVRKWFLIYVCILHDAPKLVLLLLNILLIGLLV